MSSRTPSSKVSRSPTPNTPRSPKPNARVQSDENPGPIKIDSDCIRDALRTYFQPIKNDDPVQDFYTMYKRETMEYDTEYMNKYNEDLNTTLIFAGLFSAVSSAFVIAFQPGLQQDPSDRSEAYLRAILLSINPSISPDEYPTPTSTWNGPPQEIVTTLDLLYASLLMSLLAAFVAMLGKQWVNRYLRHTGGSMIERCGDRQRKFDGVEKWPFRAFIESLPIMLQIALFLLTSGLSHYMWSINGSVARVIISFTLLGFFFYIGIVISGTSSYECPFQTPVSAGLRRLKDSGVARRILTMVSSFTPTPSRVVPNNTRKPRQASRKSTSALSLPSTFDDTDSLPPTPRGSTGLRIEVRDLGRIQKRNTANGRCVCWVLRNMTDPEAIDFAICLAGIIRWFDGGLDCDPPFDTIVSFFMACFDSAKQLYPNMKDRAYFSARAILQIHARARGQPYERAIRYPIPDAPSSPLPRTDDLSNLLNIFENLHHPCPDLKLPDMYLHTAAHSSWVSSLFVDLVSVSLNPRLARSPYLSCTINLDEGYRSAATTNHQVVIANTLLMVDMSLGGHIEGETFWAVDKSDSLNTVFSHLSTTVISVIAPAQDPPNGLNSLLWFLAAWKQRPDWLTEFAFRWCCVVLEETPRSPDPPPPRLRYHTTSTDNLVAKFLEIGFRLVDLDYRSNQIAPLDYVSHFDRIFRTAASEDDEVIADALCAWITHQKHTSHCPLEILFDKRKGAHKPFSPRLRRVSTRTIEDIWRKKLGVSEALLKCLGLYVKLDEMKMQKHEWGKLIFTAVRSSPGASLPLHHWRLLDCFSCDAWFPRKFEDPCDVNTMKLLEENGKLEELEVWMGVIWQFPERPVVTRIKDVERITLKLLLRLPSALPRFRELGTRLGVSYLDRKLLELLCTLAPVPPSPQRSPVSPPSLDIIRAAKSIGATPGSPARAYPESTYDSEPGDLWEGEIDDRGGGTENSSRGEGDQPPGSKNHNSEQSHSGPTIATSWPIRAVPNWLPPVEDHPDNSICYHSPLPSPYISAPHEIKQSTIASDEPVQNDESQKTTSEREYVEQYLLALRPQECVNLVGAERDAVLEKMRSRHNCGCDACRERWRAIEGELSLQYSRYYRSQENWVDTILRMLPQAHGPRPSAGASELDENNPIITVALNGSDSRVGAGNPESESGHRNEAARAGSDGDGLSSFGDNVAIADHSLTAANDPPRNNRQEVLEEFVKAMADRRIVFESAATTDAGGHNEDHNYDHSQLASEIKEVCSIFVPRLLSLWFLEVQQETRRVLLERPQTYRRWRQELIDEDERVAVKE